MWQALLCVCEIMSLDTTRFNETKVIKSLRSKQKPINDPINIDINSEPELTADEDAVNQLLNEVTPNEETPEAPKSNRGRKRKYSTDEERILARRAQQKAYRERKKRELLELRALKASLESESQK